MGKLVRDGIPDIIRDNGREPDVRVLDPAAYLVALLDKAVEESIELREAPEDKRLEEMGDVLEVLDALAAALGATPESVRAEANRKRHERGGFERRLWLESW